MRGLAHFLGAIGFLLIFPAGALIVAIPFFLAARALGAELELQHWLTFPIALISVVASYHLAKRAHYLLAKVL